MISANKFLKFILIEGPATNTLLMGKRVASLTINIFVVRLIL